MEVSFTTERHVKYYLRCLKTFLPSAYTSNDSNRMLLAYLTLSGLDVLGVLQSKTTLEERTGYINWLYHCQVPTGGFRGFPGTDFGSDRRNADNEAWDPANVPATFFALVNLLILGDDLSRVNRKGCLEWLPRVQREDGSFGELVGPDGSLGGARDLRYCCCAAGIRYILRGRGSGLEGVPDIDVAGLISFIEACQVGVEEHIGMWLLTGTDLRWRNGGVTFLRITQYATFSLTLSLYVRVLLDRLMAGRWTYLLRDWSSGLLAQVQRLNHSATAIGWFGAE